MIDAQTNKKEELCKNLKGIFENCGERAGHYDANNLFFQEDFDELKKAGYLLMAVPEEFGGYGMKLDECMALTRKLAYHAAPTALALNMHVYWTGLAADLLRNGHGNRRHWPTFGYCGPRMERRQGLRPGMGN